MPYNLSFLDSLDLGFPLPISLQMAYNALNYQLFWEAVDKLQMIGFRIVRMRNHLAEDILSSEMLNTMTQFQASLGENGNVMNGIKEILKQASKYIDIFRDMRPIIHIDGPRIAELLEISKWFTTRKDLNLRKENHRFYHTSAMMTFNHACLAFVGL